MKILCSKHIIPNSVTFVLNFNSRRVRSHYAHYSHFKNDLCMRRNYGKCILCRAALPRCIYEHTVLLRARRFFRACVECVTVCATPLHGEAKHGTRIQNRKFRKEINVRSPTKPDKGNANGKFDVRLSICVLRETIRILHMRLCMQPTHLA